MVQHENGHQLPRIKIQRELILSGRCKEHLFSVGEVLSNATEHVPIFQDENANTHGRTLEYPQSKH